MLPPALGNCSDVSQERLPAQLPRKTVVLRSFKGALLGTRVFRGGSPFKQQPSAQPSPQPSRTSMHVTTKGKST